MPARWPEKLVFGDVTTGPNSDLKSATNTARRMVTEFGMSDVVGPVFLGGDHEVFLGRDFSQAHANYSEEVAARVDSEIRRLLEEGMAQCYAIFKDHMRELEALVEILLERERRRQKREIRRNRKRRRSRKLLLLKKRRCKRRKTRRQRKAQNPKRRRKKEIRQRKNSF